MLYLFGVNAKNLDLFIFSTIIDIIGDNMIRLGKKEPLIRPKGLEFKKGQDNIRLPKVAIGVFSKHLFNEIVRNSNARKSA